MPVLNRSILIIAIACVYGTVGCEKHDHSHQDTPSTNPTVEHDHDHHDHGNHGHGDLQNHTITIAGTTLSLDIEGKPQPNLELHLELNLTSGDRPEDIRIWFGPQSGEGAMKTKADSHGDHWHGHVECPGTITSQDALWIEIEDSEGNRVARSIKVT